MTGLGFNKLCEIEDFDDPELAATIKEVCKHKAPHLPPGYPKGAEHRKDWEVAMAVRTLERHGALRPDSLILGVAAGVEDTLFYLTGRVRQVFAIDRYLVPGIWDSLAPTAMLVEPEGLAPYQSDMTRLVVQHMDGRSLRYPADMFDGIFSSGSIEHFGQLKDVAHAAYEMGRVLKPGGILSLSTEFKLSGPTDGIGWPGITILFSRENIQRYIVDASGLALVDDFDPSVSDATLAGPRYDLVQAAEKAERKRRAGAKPSSPGFVGWVFPHLVLVNGDYVFGSVHLALTKTGRYPEVPNEWARPAEPVLAEIRDYNRTMLHPPAAPSSQESVSAETASLPVEDLHASEQVSDPGSRWQEAEAESGVMVRCYEESRELLAALDEAREDADRALLDLARFRDSVVGRLSGPDLLPFHEPPEPASAPDLVTVAGRSFLAPAGNLLFRDADQTNALELMSCILEPGHRMVDLGPDAGYFSLTAAACGCHVIALNDSPDGTARLRSAAWANGFHTILVFDAQSRGKPDPRGTEWVPGPQDWAGLENPPETNLRVFSLDNLLPEVGWDKADLVRLNIAGKQPSALIGMKGLLARADPPVLLYRADGIELAKAGLRPRDLVEALEGHGYFSYLVGPGRLTRISSEDMQMNAVSDYLAVKIRPPGLNTWIIAHELTLEDQLAAAERESRHPDPGHRAYLAEALASFQPPAAEHFDVLGLLGRLRQDPSELVRSAATQVQTAGAEGR